MGVRIVGDGGGSDSGLSWLACSLYPISRASQVMGHVTGHVTLLGEWPKSLS